MAIGHARDPSAWIMYVILFHAVLYLLLIIGSFQGASHLTSNPSSWGIVDVASFLSTGEFWTTLMSAGVVSAVLGFFTLVTGKLVYGIVFGILAGLFVTTWAKIGVIFSEVISTAGPYGFIIIAFTVIIGTAFTYVTINAILQSLSPTRFGA